MKARVPNLQRLALGYLAGGLSMLPVGRDKRPVGVLLPVDPDTGKNSWKPWQRVRPEAAVVRQWFRSPRVVAVGAIGGHVSGGLLVLDFDVARFYEVWKARVGTSADGLPVQRTGREGGGYQVWFRCSDPGPNQELAWIADPIEKSGRKAAIETRGEGGYALLPGSLHPSGRRYEVVSGDFSTVPTVEQALADALLAHARALDECPLTKQETARLTRAVPKGGAARKRAGNVIEAYNAAHPIAETLARFEYVQEVGDRWTRPGAGASPGGVLILNGQRSVHFSSNDPLHDARHSYDSFGVFCALAHNGDVRAAVRAAAEELGIAAPARRKRPDRPSYPAAVPGVNAGSVGPDGELILSPGNPLASARALVLRNFTREQFVTVRHHRGVFYTWDGTHYTELPDAECRREVYSFLDAAVRSDAVEGLVPFSPNRKKVDDVIDALKAEVNLAAAVEPPTWLRSLPAAPDAADLFACANGLLHVVNGELLAHTPELFVLNALPYEFVAAGPEPAEWLKFMDDCFPDDAESIEGLQEAMGYSVGWDTSQQKAFMFIGPPRSGKGTIGRTWRAMLGVHNVVTPTLASLTERFGLAPFINRRLAMISDARLTGRADQAIIVERVLSVTGEDALTIDRKFIQPWSGRLPTLIAIMSNETPKLADASGAFASRFITFELAQSFLGREDTNLTPRLLRELPAILRWALAGRRRLYARGRFVQPTSGEGVAAELAELTSPIGAFLEEACLLGHAFSVPVRDLYDGWRLWCKRQGWEHAGTASSFGRDLRAAERSIRDTRPRTGGEERPRVYGGIRLKPEWSAMVRSWSANSSSPEAPF